MLIGIFELQNTSHLSKMQGSRLIRNGRSKKIYTIYQDYAVIMNNYYYTDLSSKYRTSSNVFYVP